ncbi:MAG: ABC transporter permease [Phycisphaeraceae bacterium]|nr:ABC transporter permease [Phycisphaeraceae bacterium]
MFIRFMLQTVVLALTQIWSNKFRAALTALGIVIGVSAVVSVIAGLGGMRAGIMSELESLGAKKVWIWGNVPRTLRGKLGWDKVMLTVEEVNAITEHCPSIEALTPLIQSSWDVTAGERTVSGVAVTGIGLDWHKVENREILQGRPMSRIDHDEKRPVCVINEEAIPELDLNIDPVGQHLLIDGNRFLIVGVVENEPKSVFTGSDTNAQVLIPYETSLKMNRYGWIWATASIASPDLVDEARREVRFVLRKLRNLSPEDEDTFNIEILQQAIDQFNGMAAAITAVVGGVVSVLMLVAGIGIMNIMLASVSERTREIGLRKAVGARPAVVMLQFLAEAVTLCVVGAVIGLLVGQGLVLLAQAFPKWNLDKSSIPAWAMIMAVAFSAGCGIVFGMFPAIKAARMDPIEALRHE